MSWYGKCTCCECGATVTEEEAYCNKHRPKREVKNSKKKKSKKITK